MIDLIDEKKIMIEEHLKRRDIVDEGVLKAMEIVPRELFILDELRTEAYQDSPLPIGENQTISQPYIVALMTQELNLKGNEKVLEIGTGSGYQTAILSPLVKKVYSIERKLNLAEEAKRRLKNHKNIKIIVGDGSKGYKKAAPYDAILVTAGAKSIPKELKEELKEGGRMVIPVGRGPFQRLLRLTKKGDRMMKKFITNVSFVPLAGDY